MKTPPKLSQDLPSNLKVYQGVAVSEIPKAKLGRSIDDLLAERESMPDSGPAMEAETPGTQDAGQAIAEPKSAVAPAHNAEFADVPVELIDAGAYQPRLEITADDQDQLTESIAVSGRVNRPIWLRRNRANGRFDLIGGHTRFNSVVALGWPTVPSLIFDVDDAEAEILAASDNTGQKELSDFESGRYYARILKRGQVSERALSTRLGVSRTTLKRCLSFMQLPSQCLAFMEKHPRAVGIKLINDFLDVGQKNPDLLLKAFEKIVEEGITQEGALRWLSNEINTRSEKPKGPSFSESEITLGSGQSAKMVCRKNTISLQIPKNVDMQLAQEMIKRALENMQEPKG